MLFNSEWEKGNRGCNSKKVVEKIKHQQKNSIPEHSLPAPGVGGIISESSGSSGIGLRSGFFEARSLSPYKDF